MTGPPEPERDRATGGASRETSESSSFTAIAPSYELREIVVAQGLQFTNALYESKAVAAETNPELRRRTQIARSWREMKVPHALQTHFPTLEMEGDDRAEYTSEAQQVHFSIRIVNTKDAFKAALETPRLHVVYYGHARHGLGPCFRNSASEDPGEDWGNGGDPIARGIFRMGFPFVAMPVGEIIEHQYTVNPVDGTDPKPASADCHPDIRAVYSGLRRFTPAQLKADVFPFIDGDADPAVTFWGFDKAAGRASERRHLILHAGWEHTIADPLDLGATDVQCRVFCHFGCSSFRNNYRVLRFLKDWRRTEDDRFAYWTSAPSPGPVTVYWLRHILGYGTRNDFESWRPSIEYAVRHTNRTLRSAGWSYHLV